MDGTGVPGTSSRRLRIAIQGEPGSNSHMAALTMLGDVDLLPCALASEVLESVLAGRADAAVLPIENSLHGSVVEHYDLLLEHAVRIDAESLLRIRHNLIALPGVELAEVRHILSHPVALSQCRRFLRSFRQAAATPFYDTAGSVKHVVENGLRDTAGLAPELAAQIYGANVLLRGLEDDPLNFTRFLLLRRREDAPLFSGPAPDKMSLAFRLEHRPGSLVAALAALAGAGVNLTRVESRPIAGRPWEYIFSVDACFDAAARAETALDALQPHCIALRELGRYRAAAMPAEPKPGTGAAQAEGGASGESS